MTFEQFCKEVLVIVTSNLVTVILLKILEQLF
ncbi:hypothetical protein PTHTG4_27440 [Parageobacillus thermoglucosidasius]|nr:hypothetical protein PTHTG4_27440 [Parageobacillus thermoglucosidasius]